MSDSGQMIESIRWALQQIQADVSVDVQWPAGIVQVIAPAANLATKAQLEKAIKSLWTLPQTPVIHFVSAFGPIVPKKANPFGLNIRPKAIEGVRNIVAIASGKGGVGKSTLTSNLAVALAELGQAVGIIDADIYGPSMPMMFGLQAPLQVNAQTNRLIPLQRHGVKLVSFGSLTDAEEPIIWRGPMVSKAFQQFAFDVEWGALDVLLIDLPPGTGDIQLTMIENLPMSAAIIITTPQDVALIDAHKAVSMFEKLQVPILGLVENMAGFHCLHCHEINHVFGSTEQLNQFLTERQIDKLASIPLNPRISRNADLGYPVAISRDDESEAYYQLATNIIEGFCNEEESKDADGNQTRTPLARTDVQNRLV